MPQTEKLARNGKLATIAIFIASPLVRIVAHQNSQSHLHMLIEALLFAVILMAFFITHRWQRAMKNATSSTLKLRTQMEENLNELKPLQTRRTELLHEAAALHRKSAQLRRTHTLEHKQQLESIRQRAAPLEAQIKLHRAEVERLQCEVATSPDAARAMVEKLQLVRSLTAQIANLHRENAEERDAKRAKIDAQAFALHSQATELSEEANALQATDNYQRLSRQVGEQTEALRKSAANLREISGIKRSC